MRRANRHAAKLGDEHVGKLGDLGLVEIDVAMMRATRVVRVWINFHGCSCVSVEMYMGSNATMCRVAPFSV
jgi:hypothetical protein